MNVGPPSPLVDGSALPSQKRSSNGRSGSAAPSSRRSGDVVDPKATLAAAAGGFEREID